MGVERSSFTNPLRSKVSVIVLNWNGRQDTLECLESLSHIDYPNFDVIIVDNGSSDGSVGAIRERFREAIILETGKNIGFAAGNNVGIRYAMGENARYLLLLNNDTTVDPQILRKLVEAAERTIQEGIFGAKIYSYFEPEKIWYAGARWVDEILHFEHIGQGTTDEGQDYSSFKETDYACGCALFVSADLLRNVGLLDEKFFLTFEEADLCWRARRKGFHSYYVPDAIVWHKISRAFGGENTPLFCYFLTRNRLLWAEKNLPFKTRLRLFEKIGHQILLCLLPPRPRLKGCGSGPFRERLLSCLNEYRLSFARKLHDPVRRAYLRATGDYLRRHFGNCPEEVRVLCRSGVSADGK
jgi:GT2 family glycosyltransferase